jgi:hypothetical protein
MIWEWAKFSIQPFPKNLRGQVQKSHMIDRLLKMQWLKISHSRRHEMWSWITRFEDNRHASFTLSVLNLLTEVQIQHTQEEKYLVTVASPFFFFFFDGLCFLACSHSELILKLRILQALVRTLGRGISPPQGRYLHRRQYTYIHASSGIRTHDPSVWTGEEDSCLRSHGHCDQR